MDQQELQINEIIEDIVVFLPKLIEASDSVSVMLYEPMTEQAWEQFGDVVEGIDDLYKTLNVINSDISQHLSDAFQGMNNCMDDEDYIGASDSIRYILIPLFQRIANVLGDDKSQMVKQDNEEPHQPIANEISKDDALFEKNLTFFEKRFPEVYALIKSSVRDSGKYQIYYAKNGAPNLYIADEKPIYMYSKYNPQYEAKRWVDTIVDKVEDKTYVILFGFGFGYHAQSYVEAYPEHNLYIYEPDEQILLAAMCVIDMESIFINRNIKDFVVGRDKTKRTLFLYRFLKFMKGTPGTIALPVYDRIKDSEKLEFFSDAQTSIMNYTSSNLTYDKFGLQWVKNSLFNLGVTLSTPSFTGMKNSLKGITAVIVGAGPSLEADIEYLRKMKNHALIIAAGSTIQSLRHFGIDPHLIVSIDGGIANYDVFKDLDTSEIPFLYCPMIEYQIIENRFDNLYHVQLESDHTTKHFLGLTDEDATFMPSQSVTGTAIQAAIYMGCKELIFTGQDLSYPTESMYAPGAQHLTDQSRAAVLKRANLVVENVKGTTNRTNQGMKVTLDGIEDMLARFPDIRYINTTQMGAKIKYTEWQPMESVLTRLQDNYLEVDFFKKSLVNALKYDERRISEVWTRIEEMFNGFPVIEEKLRKIDRSLGNLAKLSRTNQKKCFSEIAAIDREWHTVVHSDPFISIHLKVFRNDILIFEREIADLSKEKDIIKRTKRIEVALRPLVKNLLNRTPEFFDLLIEARRRVESRGILATDYLTTR